MFALIRKCESSGLSQEEFFRQHGVARSTFLYWRRKYLKDGSETTVPEKGKFIPVKLSGSEQPVEITGIVEVIYPSGIRVVCPAEMDLSRLAPIIR